MCVQSIARPFGTAVNASPLLRVVTLGSAGSVVAVLSFASLHAWLIMPIWTRALMGGVTTLAATIPMAWAFEALNARPSVTRGARFGAVLFLTIAPGTILELTLRSGDVRLNEYFEVAAVVLLALASGAAAGAAMGRSRKAIVPFAIAAAGLTLVMGGPIPVGNSARAMWLFVGFLPTCILSGVALAACARVLEPS